MNQRMTALAKANRMRKARQDLKREVGALSMKEGLRWVAGIVKEPDDVTTGMRVYELLRACHHIGEEKALAFLRRAGVNRESKCGGLTFRQQDVLIGDLLAKASISRSTRERAA